MKSARAYAAECDGTSIALIYATGLDDDVRYVIASDANQTLAVAQAIQQASDSDDLPIVSFDEWQVLARDP